MWRPLPFKYIYLTIGFLLCLLETISGEGKFGNGDPIPEKHRENLEKFKVIAKDIVYMDYQKEDLFLFNWLRGSEFDLENAKRRLMKSISWRKEKKIDSLSENPEIQKLSKIYKHSVDSVDKEGRPVLEFNGGRWDLRKITLSGKREEMQLYYNYMLEMAMEKTRNLTASTGKNISDFIYLSDVTGFSVRTSACLTCLGLLGGVVTDFQNNYAGFVHAIIMANAPRAFDIILNFLKPIMSPLTKDSLVVLTNDPKELKKYFSTIIADDQLGKEYGGKRTTSVGRVRLSMVTRTTV